MKQMTSALTHSSTNYVYLIYITNLIDSTLLSQTSISYALKLFSELACNNSCT